MLIHILHKKLGLKRTFKCDTHIDTSWGTFLGTKEYTFLVSLIDSDLAYCKEFPNWPSYL